MPKWIPKLSPKPRFGRSGARLLRFWDGFRGVRFLMSFRTAKSLLKLDKVGGLGRPMGAIPVIWGRVGGRGAAAWMKRGALKRMQT